MVFSRQHDRCRIGTRPGLIPVFRCAWGKNKEKYLSSSIFALALAGIFLAASGCRSRAYQDIYTEKLTGRVRVLENQLHEADYEIKVLRQQLERRDAELQAMRLGTATETDRKRSGQQSGSGEGPDPRPGSGTLAPLPERRESPAPVPPREDQGPLSSPSLEELDIDLGTPSDSLGSPVELPRNLPPSQPIPPAMEETLPPPIELGEPLPPAGKTDERLLPPGQINAPDSARLLTPPEPSIPTRIVFHHGLTTRHHHDSDTTIDGVFTVVSVEDQLGKQIHAVYPISFVMLDPGREGEDARLGRWDFTATDVRLANRDFPRASIQFPLLWQEKRPAGNQVAIFVRMTLDDGNRLETDLMLDLREALSSDWKPQGLGTGIPVAPRAAILPPGLQRKDLWR